MKTMKGHCVSWAEGVCMCEKTSTLFSVSHMRVSFVHLPPT